MVQLIEVEQLDHLTNEKLPPICADLDEDCPTLENHLACWLYDMGRGSCPYCSSTGRRVTP